MGPIEESDFDLAMRYRTGLEKIYWIVQRYERCECEFVPNWTELMDRGVPHTSAELRQQQHICFHCQVEYAYAEAIGEELFAEQEKARIMGFLDEHFTDPVAVQVNDKDGVPNFTIVERADIEEFAKENNLGEIDDYIYGPDDDTE